jgi:hypothetical protein
METLVSIIAVLLLALNLPMTVALFMGIKTHTTSTCEEDQRSARHNRMMLKGIALADVAMAIVLFIASL